jgi:hypothetical protein
MILSTQYTTPYVYRLLSSVHNRPSPEIKKKQIFFFFSPPDGGGFNFPAKLQSGKEEKKVKKMN